MYAIAMMLQEGTPLWKRVLADIPHDPAALVVYALLAGSIYLVLRGSRRKA